MSRYSISLFWITHPTNQLSAFSRRDTTYIHFTKKLFQYYFFTCRIYMYINSNLCSTGFLTLCLLSYILEIKLQLMTPWTLPAPGNFKISRIFYAFFKIFINFTRFFFCFIPVIVVMKMMILRKILIWHLQNQHPSPKVCAIRTFLKNFMKLISWKKILELEIAEWGHPHK